MGIQRLNMFLKKKAPAAFIELPIHHLSNQSIAIDTSILLYRLMGKATKIVINQTNLNKYKLCRRRVMTILLKLTLHFVRFWTNNNIKPVFVFDGTSSTEKHITNIKRYNRKVQKTDKIEKLYNAPLRNVNQLKKELKNHIVFTAEEKEMYKKYIKSLHLMCIDAPGEAEKLCSMLCIEGYVKAVYSLDTDVFAYGCPLTIIDFNNKTLTCVSMDIILQSLRCTQSMFIDFSILCGCDYNHHYEQDGKRDYKDKEELYLILYKYGCIEQLPFLFNKASLNYEYCRNEFMRTSCHQLVSTSILSQLQTNNN